MKNIFKAALIVALLPLATIAPVSADVVGVHVGPVGVGIGIHHHHHRNCYWHHHHEVCR